MLKPVQWKQGGKGGFKNWQKESSVVTDMLKEYFPLLLARLFMLFLARLFILQAKSCSEIFPENLKSGFRTCGLYPLDRNEVLRKLPKTITEAQVDQSMNETLIDLLQTKHGDKCVIKKSWGKHVEAGIIVNTEPAANYVSDSSSEEEDEDDGTVCKICSIKWSNGLTWQKIAAYGCSVTYVMITYALTVTEMMI